jgi:hypothetical protein
MKYTNIILSSNPCPVCLEAEGKVMTLPEWRKSRYGLPNSKKRYCNLKKFSCHCLMLEVGLVDQFPRIGKGVKLRSDPDTDIKAVVDIHPNEKVLMELMDEYNATKGRLPDEFYEIPLEQCIPFLRKLLGKGA